MLDLVEYAELKLGQLTKSWKRHTKQKNANLKISCIPNSNEKLVEMHNFIHVEIPFIIC